MEHCQQQATWAHPWKPCVHHRHRDHSENTSRQWSVSHAWFQNILQPAALGNGHCRAWYICGIGGGHNKKGLITCNFGGLKYSLVACSCWLTFSLPQQCWFPEMAVFQWNSVPRGYSYFLWQKGKSWVLIFILKRLQGKRQILGKLCNKQGEGLEVALYTVDLCYINNGHVMRIVNRQKYCSDTGVPCNHFKTRPHRQVVWRSRSTGQSN